MRALAVLGLLLFGCDAELERIQLAVTHDRAAAAGLVEGAPDQVVDPEPVADPDSDPGADPDPVVEPDPDPDPGVEPDPGPDPDPVVEPDPDPVVEPASTGTSWPRTEATSPRTSAGNRLLRPTNSPTNLLAGAE